LATLIQVALVICGLFICDFSYMRLYLCILEERILQFTNAIGNRSHYMLIHYFLGPYLSHKSRAACTTITQVLRPKSKCPRPTCWLVKKHFSNSLSSLVFGCAKSNLFFNILQTKRQNVLLFLFVIFLSRKSGNCLKRDSFILFPSILLLFYNTFFWKRICLSFSPSKKLTSSSESVVFWSQTREIKTGFFLLFANSNDKQRKVS